LRKIDAEGLEKDVLLGAARPLEGPALLALVVGVWDTNCSGARRILSGLGFRPFGYDPFGRLLAAGSNSSV